MRGRPPGRVDMRRKPGIGRPDSMRRRDDRNFRPNSGRRDDRPFKHDFRRDGRRPDGRRPHDGSFGREPRRVPQFEVMGVGRPRVDHRRPIPPLLTDVDFPPPAVVRPGHPSYDMLSNNSNSSRQRRGPDDLEFSPPPERPMVKKRPIEKELRDDDLRKRLRRNFRSKSPQGMPPRDEFARENSPRRKEERPIFRGPEEEFQFDKEELRKIQINIYRPLGNLDYDKMRPPRPASPESGHYPARDEERGRPRVESYVGGSYRDHHQSWDDDIALHRMKNEGARHSESNIRKPFRRSEDMHRDLPDRRDSDRFRSRGPHSDAPRGRGRDRGSHRGGGPGRHSLPYEGRGDRQRYERDFAPQRDGERRDRERIPRDPPRFSDGHPRGSRPPERPRSMGSYSFPREPSAQVPAYDYPPRRTY